MATTTNKVGIEHSENRIYTQFELVKNEIGPGVLHSSIQPAYMFEKCQRHKALTMDYVRTLSLLSGVFEGTCFLNAGFWNSRSNLVIEKQDNVISKCSVDQNKMHVQFLHATWTGRWHYGSVFNSTYTDCSLNMQLFNENTFLNPNLIKVFLFKCAVCSH